MDKKVLITGVAGFIGFNLCKKLMKEKINIIGIDNLNSYYDTNLKKARLDNLKNTEGNFNFFKVDIEDKEKVDEIFLNYKPSIVINLAAQAGVRYSIKNPRTFISTNIQGFVNILEACKNNQIEHLVYASSSSVYGGNEQLPYSENNIVDHPVSIYAASKKANELIAHAYSHLYSIPCTGLRFFTVYGPWGRPDMSYFLFTKAILAGENIKIFNHGQMARDFTYIDDICESLFRIMKKAPTGEKAFDKKNPLISSSWAPHKIFNIGNSNSITLMEFIESIEKELGVRAKKNFLPMQPGDVKSTLADTSLLENWINYKPSTKIKDGIKEFVHWYKFFYKKA
ncbi:NAD-dependent epimerase [Prochlorococcus marinus]|uniref:dTDP-glucose 4,6-dehydratase n=1 Tax=Prochlorococcus marinus str. GP2 TaxID=59925 RepID=A0A0A1ZA90_PROMR|nr:NAD-dependent epimerase [Prochlorococcus marinus]KGF86497.1 dTDP-glucose 4,6-dehydratase [Prochlorococcus marinus str. GP2]